jgi:invasion protein IalB
MRLALGGVLLATIVAGMPAMAGAQSASAPAAGNPATQTFKDWALDCLVPKTGEGAGKRVCFIHHEVHSAADPSAIAARLVMRRSGPDRKLALIVQLPPNSVQTSGLSLAIDAGNAYPIAIQACLPKFCYGATDLTAEIENGAKAGHQMNLVFTAKDKGPQQLVVPLSGITAALDALAKTGS